ncbi:MAG: glycosyltransferase family 2 protein, partial [Cyanobacteria bacterium P01_F01_bin.4]
AYQPGRVAIAGWRQQRGDGKITASQLANRACRWAFGLKIHDMNWIKLVRRDALVGLPIELITHRFLLAVLARLGHSVVEVATPWHPRFSGASKFGKKRLVTSAQDFLRVLVWFYLERPWVQRSKRVALSNAQFGEKLSTT